MHYRPADLSDIAAMARIRAEGGGEGGATADRMARYLQGEHHPQHALPPRVIYVALNDDLLAGYIAGHLTRRYACDGELQWIYISSEHRRQGIASELLRRLAAWFAEQQSFRVCVNVEPVNTIARRFYTHHGAQPLNEHWLIWNDLPAAVRGR